MSATPFTKVGDLAGKTTDKKNQPLESHDRRPIFSANFDRSRLAFGTKSGWQKVQNIARTAARVPRRSFGYPKIGLAVIAMVAVSGAAFVTLSSRDASLNSAAQHPDDMRQAAQTTPTPNQSKHKAAPQKSTPPPSASPTPTPITSSSESSGSAGSYIGSDTAAGQVPAAGNSDTSYDGSTVTPPATPVDTPAPTETPSPTTAPIQVNLPTPTSAPTPTPSPSPTPTPLPDPTQIIPTPTVTPAP